MRSSMTRFLKVSSLLAVASVMGLAPVLAKDPAAPADKVSVKGAAAHGEVVLPACLAKIEMTAEQEEKVKEIVSKTDASMAKVWGQFGHRYTQMVKAEAAMLAAIEDHLTEPQLKQVRMHRQRTAHHGRRKMGSNATKPAAPKAVTEPANENATEAEEQLAQNGVTLTAAQAEASDKIQEKYQTNLEVLHNEIQELHARLLALETDKLAEIEKVLTKEQLVELRKNRDMPPATVKVASDEDEPAKNE